jgi:hypothetical protein
VTPLFFNRIDPACDHRPQPRSLGSRLDSGTVRYRPQPLLAATTD